MLIIVVMLRWHINQDQASWITDKPDGFLSFEGIKMHFDLMSKDNTSTSKLILPNLKHYTVCNEKFEVSSYKKLISE